MIRCVEVLRFPTSNLKLSFSGEKLMRKLRQFGIAAALTLAFATYGFAGIVGCPPDPEPAPASATVILSVIQVVVSVP
jgi:hypothetical protein